MTRSLLPSLEPLTDVSQTSSRHGGNLRDLAGRCGRQVQDILDFSANINPLGPPTWLRRVISRQIENLIHYPEPDAGELVKAIAQSMGVLPQCVLAGNGSAEILYALPRVLNRNRAVIPVPAYVDYAVAAAAAGLEVVRLPLREAEGLTLNCQALSQQLCGDEIVLLGQPNNPTGLPLDRDALMGLATENPQTQFVIDEAFADFMPDYQSLVHSGLENVVVLRSLTKFYAIPGLRAGFVVASPPVIQLLKEQIPPWSVNTLAQAVSCKALADTEFAAASREFVTEQRQILVKALEQLTGLHVYRGVANYLLVRMDHDELNSIQLADQLLQREGIAIRSCANVPGLDSRFFRVAVRTEKQNTRLVHAIAQTLDDPESHGVSAPLSIASTPKRPKPRRAATLMFQGTSSNAGKSVLTAAMCRILLQDGLRVAPFKAQNMSLNSFVTRDGGEMGRAQVVQAQACRLEPDVRMNPLLLKPNSDTGSQIILCGKPVQNMNFTQYNQYKPQAIEQVHGCFDTLADEFDAVVLEGAGSPGEVNLKRQDLVNMAMARYAKAPVLLVGDIDRGGVYAAFVGTMEVLDPWERQLLRGFVVNRFRGDASLLGPAHDYVLSHTGRPVLGVVPYLSDLNLPSEDSVDFKNGLYTNARDAKACVDIAILDLPHISNFTDLDALRIEPDVSLRIVSRVCELGQPDALLIPGSKNTLGDMQHLHQQGFTQAIRKLAETGKTQIVGICGGYQMLGSCLLDPKRLESQQGRTAGLDLLPLQTVMAKEKTLVYVQATHLPSGLPVHGYEIHHGQTHAPNSKPLLKREDGQTSGVTSDNAKVWGTYLHGVFDADEFRRWFIDQLRRQRGWSALETVQATFDLEPALDRLADTVRQSLDMKVIYQLMGL